MTERNGPVPPVKKPQTYDHLKSRKKPVTRSVLIPLDNDQADAYSDARNDRDNAKELCDRFPNDRKYQDDLEKAEGAFQAAKAVLENNSVEFTFRNIGRRRVEDLILDHLPTDKQIQRAKDLGAGRPEYNPDTFPPALVAACLVSPKFTPDEIADMYESEDWSGGELDALFGTAMRVNSQFRNIELGKDSS